MPVQRIRQHAPATLVVNTYDQNGELADAAGALTVAVNQADGTVVLTAGTATAHPGIGTYNVTLTAAQTATLNLLTGTWTDAGSGAVWSSSHEIVGGFYFSVADARASDPQLADQVTYPDADILERRQEVEEECEVICDLAFVPRYRRVTLDGSGWRELLLPDEAIRTVRSVRVYTNVTDPTVFTAFTAAQLAALVPTDDGRIERTDSGIFNEGIGNVVVEYECGQDRPPSDLRRAAMVRLRHLLNANKTGVPDRAVSYTSADGGTYRLDTPEAYKTGIPDVDSVYGRHSRRLRDDDGPVPASRPMNFDPSWWSMFHGGRR